MPAREIKTDPLHDLRTAVTLLRGALEVAPNPRQTDGPPAMWEWYDGLRVQVLELTKDL